MRLVMFRGVWCAYERVAGQPRRTSLGTTDREVAARRLIDLEQGRRRKATTRRGDVGSLSGRAGITARQQRNVALRLEAPRTSLRASAAGSDYASPDPLLRRQGAETRHQRREDPA